MTKLADSYTFIGGTLRIVEGTHKLCLWFPLILIVLWHYNTRAYLKTVFDGENEQFLNKMRQKNGS